jgi:ATP-dependent exoDNAse (exonuclease V) alpha subunit
VQKGKETCTLLFNDPLWKTWKFKTIILKENFRQSGDLKFQEFLQQIRVCNLNGKVYKFFEERRRARDTLKRDILRVFFTNRETLAYNDKRLRKLASTPVTFNASITLYNNFKYKDYPFQTPELITIKEGARIIILRNLPDLKLINGTLAKITKIDSANKIVYLITKKREVPLPMCKETICNSKQEKLAEILGFPLQIAYGLTVHKVQGLTLKSIVIKVKRFQFVPHLFYVAISRVQEAKNLHLIATQTFLKIFLDNLRVLPLVEQFYDNHKETDNIIDFSSDEEFETEIKKTKY